MSKQSSCGLLFTSTPSNGDEGRYLDLLGEVLYHGEQRDPRPGFEYKAIFGRRLSFSLRDGAMPAITTRPISWSAVVNELLWFFTARADGPFKTNTNATTSTRTSDTTPLASPTAKRSGESSGGARRSTGDVSAIYGLRWGHFGADFEALVDNFEGHGVEQVNCLIDAIKKNPQTETHVLEGWRPSNLNAGTSHVSCQFYVSAERELSCQVYQRTADLGGGTPFTIATYALLTAVIAKCCELTCKKLIYTMGECRVYLKQERSLREQLKLTPTPPPVLEIATENTRLDAFCASDFVLKDYTPHRTFTFPTFN